MSKRKTEQERRAELAAKIARIDARAAAKQAREASEEVRLLERDRGALNRLWKQYECATFAAAASNVEKLLEVARTAALAAQEPAK